MILDTSSETIAGKQSARELLNRLTSREIEVLAHIASGMKNHEIAHELCISTRTIETHREHVMKKTDIHSVAKLTQLALRAKLIENEFMT